MMQRTNVFDGEFSPSGVELARCPRRFYYQKILGLQPNRPEAPLVYGTAIHAAVEAFYAAQGKELSLTELQQVAIQAFIKEWRGAGIAEDKKHSLEGGVLTVSNYCAAYYRDMALFNPVDIECEQWFPMPNGTTILVKMDRVLNRGGQIVLVDTKTTGSYIGPYYFKQFENHLPTSLYAYVIAGLLGRCDSIQIDAIKKPYPSARSKAEPFGRQSFLRTPLQMEDAITSYTQLTDYIMGGLALPDTERASYYHCNQSKCSDYSGCPFLPICKHGLGHPSVSVDFTRKETANKPSGETAEKES